MQRIVKEIINTLKNFKEVEAISLGGSDACGCSDEYSDVDIYVFYIKNFTKDSVRKKHLHKLADFEMVYTGGILDYFIYKRKHIHTWWEDIDGIKKKLKERPDDVDANTLILYTKLVWDRNGKLRKLRKQIRYPPKLVKKIVSQDLTLKQVSKIFRDVVEKSISRNRIYFAEWSIKTQTDNIIKAIYALNRKYYKNYPQHLKCDFHRFKFVPKNAYENINKIGRYSLMENPKEKLTALFELYWDTIELAKKRYKYDFKTKLFPEYDDKKWYRKRINEISELIKGTKL